MNRTIMVGILLLVSISLVFAQNDHENEIDEGKRLIESGIECSKLSEEQLEAVGEYYMEQMHPGQAHELMDNMMGGEGSESLKQVHVTMAKRLYCNENVAMGYAMMGRTGMIGGAMMGNSFQGNAGYYTSPFWSFLWIVLFLVILFIIGYVIYKFSIQKTSAQTPLEILKKRFAKGEITRKEFEEIKKEMGG